MCSATRAPRRTGGGHGLFATCTYEHTREATLVHGHASALTRAKAGAPSRARNRQHAPRQHPSRAFSVVALLLPAAFCTLYAPSQAASAKWASWLGGDGVGDVHRLGIAPAMSRAEVGRVQRSTLFCARCTCVSCILHVQNDMPMSVHTHACTLSHQTRTHAQTRTPVQQDRTWCLPRPRDSSLSTDQRDRCPSSTPRVISTPRKSPCDSPDAVPVRHGIVGSTISRTA